MPAAKTELKMECIRLRVEERLSYREIQERTGASRGSLSGWLRSNPLTSEERSVCLKRSGGTSWNKGLRKDVSVESEFNRVAKNNELDSNARGKVAEAAILLRMCLRGLAVFGSSFDGDKSDWVVQSNNGKLLKVQVKLLQRGKSGMPMLPLRSSARKERYKKGDFDIIAGYDLFSDTAYVYTWDEVAGFMCVKAIDDAAREAWEKLNRV